MKRGGQNRFFIFHFPLSTFFLTFAPEFDSLSSQLSPFNLQALVAELVDAPDLGSGISDVQVRVLSGAQKRRELCFTVPVFVFAC